MEIKIYDYLHQDVKNIREQVFIEEQGFNEEFDDIDQACFFLVVYENKLPLGTLRYFKENDKWYIGRVAVKKEARGKHLGSLLMDKAESLLKHQTDKIYLEAQVRASHFYKSLGYRKTDQTHDDEGVLHVLMYKEI